MWVTVFFLTILLLIYLYIRKKYSYFRDRNIPYETPMFPLGSMGSFTNWNDIYKFTFNLYMKFKGRGPFGGIFCFLRPEVIVTDLDLIQDILVTDFRKFPDHRMYWNDTHDPLSSHIYALTGERWRNMRTKLSPAFSIGSIKAMFGTVAPISDALVELVDRYAVSGEPFIAKDIAMRYVVDAVGSCAFGVDCRGMLDEDPLIMKLATEIFQPGTAAVLTTHFTTSCPKMGKFMPWVHTPISVQEHFMGMIKETAEYRERNNVQRKDFLQLLMRMKDKGCLLDDESGEFIRSLTEAEVIAQAFLLFFLGYLNSRVALTFAIYEVAGNQEVQEKAREEIFRVLGGSGGENLQELDYQKLEEMVYIKQIADETLRKYPSSGFIERIALEDYKVRNSDHVIEKGTFVMIPVMGIQNDPDIYPDAHVFDPDRMTQEKIKHRHPSTFIPFGVGPRMCLGYKFGYLLLRLALVRLVSQFRLSINPRTKRTTGTNNFLNEFSRDDDIWIDSQRL